MQTKIIKALLLAIFIGLLGVFAPTGESLAQQKPRKGPIKPPVITSETPNQPQLNKNKKHKKRKHYKKHKKKKHHKKHKKHHSKKRR